MSKLDWREFTVAQFTMNNFGLVMPTARIGAKIVTNVQQEARKHQNDDNLDRNAPVIHFPDFFE